MPGLRTLLALGLAAGIAAAAPQRVLGAGEESSLEVPRGVRKNPRAVGSRLMRQEAPASELQLSGELLPESPQDSDAALMTCSPIMKVLKDWTVSDKHALRTGVYRMQRQKNVDGTPLYRNDHGMYLYYWNATQEWRIGWDFYRPNAGVSTPPSASTCPDMAPEWWAFVNNSWTTREGFMVLAETCSPAVIVSGAEETVPQLMGTYSLSLNCSACPPTFESCPCRPVYKNTQVYAHGTWDYYLFFWFEFGEWRIGTDINASAAAIASMEGQNRPCPAEASGWETFVDFKWQANTDLVVQRKSAKGSIYDDYQVGNANTNKCPEFTEPLNESRCESVAADLEKDYGGQADDEDQPSGCYEVHGVLGKVYFNVAGLGAAHADSYLVCQRTDEYWAYTLANAFKPTTLAPVPQAMKEISQHTNVPSRDGSHSSHASAPQADKTVVDDAESVASGASSASTASVASGASGSSAASGASGGKKSSDAHAPRGTVEQKPNLKFKEALKGNRKFIVAAVGALVVLVLFVLWRRSAANTAKAEADAKAKEQGDAGGVQPAKA